MTGKVKPPYDVTRPNAPAQFYALKDPAGFEAKRIPWTWLSTLVFAPVGPRPGSGRIRGGYVTAYTPFGQGTNVELAMRDLRLATADEVVAALKQREAGYGFLPAAIMPSRITRLAKRPGKHADNMSIRGVVLLCGSTYTGMDLKAAEAEAMILEHQPEWRDVCQRLRQEWSELVGAQTEAVLKRFGS